MRWCTGRPHLALVLLGLGVLALQAQSSQGGAGLPELTPWGASVRRVVFAVLNSGFCKSRNGDWRGDLPRHLVRFLPKAKNVVIHGRHDCRHCEDDFRHSGDDRPRECSPILDQMRSSKYKADIVMVMGSGDDIPRVLSRPYMGPDTRTVHFPIRRLKALRAANNKFNFTKVVEDDTFMKPLARSSVMFLRRKCAEAKKRSNDLLYIARLKDFKGQLQFLRRIDPSLLKGLTMHFYGAGAPRYTEKLHQVAKERGISAVVHGMVPKSDVLAHICRARGVVHYAKSDLNPRAAYEGLYAGLPLFITTLSGVPRILLDQPFVSPSDWNRDLNKDFASFLPLLEIDWTADVRWKHFVRDNLSRNGVYTGICRDIGLCA